MKNKYIVIISIFLAVYLLASIVPAKDKVEITSKNAIDIAIKSAEKKKYDTKIRSVEVLKVKKHEERGPIRLSWLIRYFPIEERDIIFKNEFWIVYFYPKGTLESPRILGGEYCVLVELYSGEVLSSFKVP